MTRHAIDTIVAYCRKHPEILLVYLYGSQARGEAKKESDIDLAVLVDEEKTNSLKMQIQMMTDLSHVLETKVDVQNLSAVHIQFAFRVISEGKLVYVKDEDVKVSYQTYVMRQYFDLKPFYLEYYACLAERARQGKIGASIF